MKFTIATFLSFWANPSLAHHGQHFHLQGVSMIWLLPMMGIIVIACMGRLTWVRQ
ncbi:hypothetical protein ACMAZE_16880 [Pseudopelagicola sp. nBUS_20]|uniref:hypothetical protein n=1 Tax=Pseudopelagicola sp. nBUS_20 TaxID=3395317 RepID=UPI003EB982BE